jgi:hypothetical protein
MRMQFKPSSSWSPWASCLWQWASCHHWELQVQGEALVHDSEEPSDAAHSSQDPALGTKWWFQGEHNDRQLIVWWSNTSIAHLGKHHMVAGAESDLRSIVKTRTSHKILDTFSSIVLSKKTTRLLWFIFLWLIVSHEMLFMSWAKLPSLQGCNLQKHMGPLYQGGR